ncbi:MAG: metallophosphoesterase [Planctomycetota bacterium]|nr:metallophosphoesterase [Planctomycetota bacterium]
MAKPIRFLHISDSHWASDAIAPGIDPKSRFDQLCAWIAAIRDPIDFIIHTGDWVHRGQLDDDLGHSTDQAWDRLQKLRLPILTAVGNHDHRKVLSQRLIDSLPAGWNIRLLDCDEGRLAYWFAVGNEFFLVLDARASQQIDPRGELCAKQLAAVTRLLADPDRHWTVFLHYPPIELDCEWIDRTMLIENGHQLHEILVPCSHRIRGVFFGHVHRPVCCLKDSILYASSGSPTMHFPNMPSNTQAIVQSDPIALANYICIRDGVTLVKTQWTMLSHSPSDQDPKL